MKTAATILSLLLLPLGVTACGSGSVFDDDDVKVRTTSFPASGALDPVASVSWFVYFAEEALDGPGGGTDLNGDGDRDDQVAVAVKFGSKTREELIGVAARGAALSRSEVWVIVDEADDGRDWNMSGAADDIVLVHWDADTGALTHVDTLEDEEALVVETDERIYYASADPLGTGDTTNLRYLRRANPTVPTVVRNAVGAGPERARVLGEKDRLLVATLDETDGGQDLNADGDADDEHVLALLDADDGDARLQNTGLAVFDESVPWNAYREGDRWLVGVLVNELAQGANLNDPALFPFELLPDTCGVADADLDDDVLFFLRFPGFDSPGRLGNTGLAGALRVVVVRDFVATLSHEADAGGCDLNNDGDTADLVVRWAEASATGGVVDVPPPRKSRLLVPVATGLPGGALGLAPLERRLVALVDEAAAGNRDFDGRAGDSLLLAWIEPEEALDARDTVRSNWDFEHDSSDPRHGTGVYASDGTSEPYASPTWMFHEPREGRLPATFDEAVPGVNPLVDSLNTNVDCQPVQKDDDLVDALPVWLDFESRTLDFDGVGFALVRDDPGLVLSRGYAYFRVSELQDNRDYNGDNDLDDLILVRNPLLECDPEVVGTLGAMPGPAVFARELGARGAAFFSTGVDFDGDGMPVELVVRHFVY